MPRLRSSPLSELPDGFRYVPEFLSAEEESSLIPTVENLPFAAFDFQGYTARRRIVEYGWEYDFSSRKASRAEPIPEFLVPLRARAAQEAQVTPAELVEAVVTEYPPGAPIGWHRDVPQFETIIGISLLSSCRMRLKPYRTEGKLVSVILEPRSLYVISGVARWQFQHSIPAVESLRYSITFRTLRARSTRAKSALETHIDAA
jgi:alkylated DNA repair dioxygenase AlkB